MNATIPLLCECGHTYQQHDGFVRGPAIQEWCDGGGWRLVPDPAFEGDTTMTQVPLCGCREYEGPDPEEAPEYPVLVMEEDGDFYVEWLGKVGERNVLWSDWTDSFLGGRFYLVAVPQSIIPNVDWGATP